MAEILETTGAKLWSHTEYEELCLDVFDELTGIGRSNIRKIDEAIANLILRIEELEEKIETGDITITTRLVDSEGDTIVTDQGEIILLSDLNYYLDSDIGTGGGGTSTCNPDACVKEILPKIKPLTFNSVDEAQTVLNSGTYTNLYYGQLILIKKDGKFINYTIQDGGSSGYIVEPLDTSGGASASIIWTDDNE